ncbi:MAG: hypothetical protein JO112_18740 [Planctomycetes bacterium]|nr:hypothetical protein [Planctomycetota bacterium]
MGVAKRVVDCELLTLEWLKIEDETGVVWRYVRGSAVGEDAPAQVVGFCSGGSATHAELAKGADGQPLLRQDGPGLPQKIVVQYVVPAGPDTSPIRTLGAAKMEYEQT